MTTKANKTLNKKNYIKSVINVVNIDYTFSLMLKIKDVFLDTTPCTQDQNAQ